MLHSDTLRSSLLLPSAQGPKRVRPAGSGQLPKEPEVRCGGSLLAHDQHASHGLQTQFPNRPCTPLPTPFLVNRRPRLSAPRDCAEEERETPLEPPPWEVPKSHAVTRTPTPRFMVCKGPLCLRSPLRRTRVLGEDKMKTYLRKKIRPREVNHPPQGSTGCKRQRARPESRQDDSEAHALLAE